ncbi:hypothetical protein [Streptomyces sp. NPDC101150]|uniref:hypothetical protein n=1 Tax=Streptomyces sp. NPDC101150 TaxID=3366114 RepID=UPI0037F3D1F4
MTDTTYPELLTEIDELASGLPRQEQLTRLYRLIEPLLARVESEDEEFTDDPVLSTPEAVRGIRRAAAGEPVDADAIHDHLSLMALVYSEDQDPDLHVISQSAYAAAGWLRLREGRPLRTSVEDNPDDLLPPFAPTPFSRLVDFLAWTRSEQIYTCWEDATAHPDVCDLQSATDALRAIRDGLRLA